MRSQSGIDVEKNLAEALKQCVMLAQIDMQKGRYKLKKYGHNLEPTRNLRKINEDLNFYNVRNGHMKIFRAAYLGEVFNFNLSNEARIALWHLKGGEKIA